MLKIDKILPSTTTTTTTTKCHQSRQEMLRVSAISDRPQALDS